MVAVKCFTSPDRKGGFSEEVRMWFSDHGFNFLSSSSESIPFPSLVPRPHPHKEKGLVSIERFLGCSKLAVLIQNKPMNETTLCHKDIKKIKIADSAQPRTHSIVTRPFSSWECGVWGRDKPHPQTSLFVCCMKWYRKHHRGSFRKIVKRGQKSMVESLGQHH